MRVGLGVGLGLGLGVGVGIGRSHLILQCCEDASVRF